MKLGAKGRALLGSMCVKCAEEANSQSQETDEPLSRSEPADWH